MFSSLAAALKSAIGIMPVAKAPQRRIIAIVGATGTGKSQVGFRLFGSFG
jgi:ABC-type multidrug transport system fused ATPase/permease subunit